MNNPELPPPPEMYKPTYEGWPECTFAIPQLVVTRGSALENYRHCSNPLAKELWKSADQIAIAKYGRENYERIKRQVEKLAEDTGDRRRGILGGTIARSNGGDILEHFQYLLKTPEEQIPDRETALKAATIKFLANKQARQRQYVDMGTCQRCPYRIA